MRCVKQARCPATFSVQSSSVTFGWVLDSCSDLSFLHSAVLTAHLKGYILASFGFHAPPLVYGSFSKNSLISCSVFALISMMLPVMSGLSPSLGCLESVAPPKTTVPASILGFRPFKCCGRTASRLSRAFGWSGIWTSHSLVGAEDDILLKWILSVVVVGCEDVGLTKKLRVMGELHELYVLSKGCKIREVRTSIDMNISTQLLCFSVIMKDLSVSS